MKTAEQKIDAIFSDWVAQNQTLAQLERRIVQALKEQDRDTRHACAEVAEMAGINQDCLHLECSLYEYGKKIATEISGKCMNVRAL